MKILFFIYTMTAYIREQLLVTMFGYKSTCKHSPTCSVYTQQMIEEQGVVQGSWLGIRRILSCW